MGPSRLSGALLARKGDAIPVGGAYGGTMLEPIAGLFGRGMIRPEPRPLDSAPAPETTTAKSARTVALTMAGPVHAAGPKIAEGRPTVSAETSRLSVRLDAEHLARLRILAARRGRRPQQLLREALEVVFATTADECPCVRGETEACCKEPKGSPKV